MFSLRQVPAVPEVLALSAAHQMAQEVSYAVVRTVIKELDRVIASPRSIL